MGKKSIAQLKKEISDAEKEEKRKKLEKKLQQLKPSVGKKIGKKVARRLISVADNITRIYG